MLSIYEYWECACYTLWNGSVCHYNHFIYMVCVSELSFNSGDEILVVGFKDGAGRWRPVSVIVRSHDIAIYHVMLYGSNVITMSPGSEPVIFLFFAQGLYAQEPFDPSSEW